MQNVIKFLFDRIMALLGLIILLPLMIVIGIIIRIKMPGGPAIFTQKRVGKDGKLFTMHKFRTMRIHDNQSTVSVRGDDRITPLGAVLRKYKLDETPELWNVLIGDMSFVGPRPDGPGYADCLKDNDREILKLRPGITGPATLKYRSEESQLAKHANPKQYNDEVIWPDKVRINRYYLHHHTFLSDIKMILCTVTGKTMKYNNEVI